MFVGAILASSTNLIFIGLVKSGQPLSDVTVNVAGQQDTAMPDDTGVGQFNSKKQSWLQIRIFKSVRIIKR